MKKKIPTFKSDRAAAAFVDKADLTQYDLSGAQVDASRSSRKTNLSTCVCPRNSTTPSANAPPARACPISVSFASRLNKLSAARNKTAVSDGSFMQRYKGLDLMSGNRLSRRYGPEWLSLDCATRKLPVWVPKGSVTSSPLKHVHGRFRDRLCPYSLRDLSISAPPTCASASSRFAVGVSFATMCRLPLSRPLPPPTITAGGLFRSCALPLLMPLPQYRTA